MRSIVVVILSSILALPLRSAESVVEAVVLDRRAPQAPKRPHNHATDHGQVKPKIAAAPAIILPGVPPASADKPAAKENAKPVSGRVYDKPAIVAEEALPAGQNPDCPLSRAAAVLPVGNAGAAPTYDQDPIAKPTYDQEPTVNPTYEVEPTVKPAISDPIPKPQYEPVNDQSEKPVNELAPEPIADNAVQPVPAETPVGPNQDAQYPEQVLASFSTSTIASMPILLTLLAIL